MFKGEVISKVKLNSLILTGTSIDEEGLELSSYALALKDEANFKLVTYSPNAPSFQIAKTILNAYK